MKKLFLIFSLCFAFLSLCLSQSSVWKLEGNGNTIYIGGTMHLLTVEDYPLPPEFDSAYAWSDLLVFEADLKLMEEPEVIQRMMTLAMYQDGRTLEGELSEEAYERLNDECSKINLPLAEMSQFKPSMVLLIYMVTKMQLKGEVTAGVDKFFLDLALEDGKELLFLESIDSQLDLLFGEDGEDENQGVLQFFDDQEKTEERGEDIKTGWREGTKKVFVKTQKEMKKEYPEIYEKILVRRNNNWMSMLESYFDSDSVEFVLVGALHLHGPDGILSMLKEKGYSVRQF